MQLTDFTDYSLRVLIYLNKTKKLATLNELSRNLVISRNNLIKISNKLEKLGYIDTFRGRSGGLQIRTHSSKMTLGSIVRHTEEKLEMAECFSDGKIHCAMIDGCVLKKCLSEALTTFLSSLDKYTLDDITPEIDSSTSLRKRPPNDLFGL